jgi:tRNA threonylcarbamoyladenosine biosynthesis protein TsaE
MMQREQWSSDSCLLLLWGLEDCESLASLCAGVLRPRVLEGCPCVIGLSGTLGSGKTQWTKYFAKHCGATPDDVASPTYLLVHRYPTSPPIYHLDAYRVGDADEFLELGVEELFEEPAFVIIEWSDRFADCLPESRLELHFEPVLECDSARSVRIDRLNFFPELAEQLRGLSSPHD